MFLNGPSPSRVYTPNSTTYGLTTTVITAPQAQTLLPFNIANSSVNEELYTNSGGLITFVKAGVYTVRALFVASPTTAGAAPKQASYRINIVKNIATTNSLIYSTDVVNNGVLTFPSPASPGPYGTTVDRNESVETTIDFRVNDTVGIYVVGLTGIVSCASGGILLYCIK